MVFAEDGAEAIRLWEQSSFDLILMDLQMPVIDGLEAAREIRKREAANGRSHPDCRRHRARNGRGQGTHRRCGDGWLYFEALLGGGHSNRYSKVRSSKQSRGGGLISFAVRASTDLLQTPLDFCAPFCGIQGATTEFA